MQESVQQTLKGVVVFLRENEGSKSEAILPFLYQGKGASLVRLFLKGDNPFENKGFTDCDGKTVELTGAFARSTTFEVTDVKLV